MAHERFHVADGQGFCRQAVSSEQQQLNQQQAATIRANGKADKYTAMADSGEHDNGPGVRRHD